MQGEIRPATVALPAAAGVLVADTPPPSYPTPLGNSTQRISGPLANFVVAHSEVAASAGRFLPLSAAMDGYDIAQGAVEMTEAEIGAYR